MPFIDENPISWSAMSRNMADLGVSKEEVKEYLVQIGYITEYGAITPLGETKGITYKTNAYGGKWAVYNTEVQLEVQEHFNVNGATIDTVETLSQKAANRRAILESINWDEFNSISIVDTFSSIPKEELHEILIANLRECYGEQANYYEGQEEAITGVLLGKHALVIQQTGWGKSLVYFMATRLIRKYTKRFTLIISPLLALMSNQIDSATRLGLNVKTINSTNEEDWRDIFAGIGEGIVDALIISPERLANEDFRKMLGKGLTDRIGLFVVDEAHCISDWGHDFRPDYRRIVDLIKSLPQDISILATTATATDRVVEDIKQQLGESVVVSRGPLIRKSIALQTIYIRSREMKLAWLAEHINELPGTGIIYCLTIDDCNNLNSWLNQNGIASVAYTSRTDSSDKLRAVEQFHKNEVKVMVATTAFGMGYDKPDIGFVIHFQKPKDVVSYYQQIGRAGRQIDEAYAILLYSELDDYINKYFIENAFPTEAEMAAVFDALCQEPGLKVKDIQKIANMPRGKIDGVLTYLSVEGGVYSQDGRYYIKDEAWTPDLEKSAAITKLRYEELAVMNEFARTKDCYMQFLAKQLDDNTACACGKCANCLGRDIIGTDIAQEQLSSASDYIDNQYSVLESRKQWPANGLVGDGKLSIKQQFRLQDGLIMCAYSDTKLGQRLQQEITEDKTLSDESMELIYKCLGDYIAANNIVNVTYVPSNSRPEMLPRVAEKIAERFGLVCYAGLQKTSNTDSDEELNNSYMQWQRAWNSYAAVDTMEGNTLLIDDMVDSKWTMTCCGYKLLEMGNGNVWPFAVMGK